MIALRSGVYFGLQAFIPAYFVVELSISEAAGNAALTIMLAMGAVGTLVGGGLVDRWGARTVLVGTQILLLPLLFVLPLIGAAARPRCSRRIGFVDDRQLLDHDRARPGVPAEPDSGSPPASRSGWRSGSAAWRPTALGVVADAEGLPAVLWIDRGPARARRSCSRLSLPDRARADVWLQQPMRGTKEVDDRSAPLTPGPDRDAVHAAPPQRLADRGPHGRRRAGRDARRAPSARWRPTRPCASSSQGIDGRARVLRQQSRDTYAVRFEMLAEPALAELQRLTVPCLRPDVLERGEAGHQHRLHGDQDLAARWSA